MALRGAQAVTAPAALALYGQVDGDLAQLVRSALADEAAIVSDADAEAAAALVLVADPLADATTEELDDARAQLLWLDASLQAERATRGRARVFLTGADLAEAPAEAAGRLSEALGLSPAFAARLAAAATQAALQAPSAAVAPGAASALRWFRDAASGREREPAELDVAARTLEAHRNLIGDLARPAVSRFGQAAEAAKLTVLRRELATSRQLMVRARDRGQQLELQLAAHRASIAAIESHVTALLEDQARRVDLEAHLRGVLNEVQQALNTEREDHVQTQHARGLASEQAEVLRGEAETLRREVEGLRGHVEILRREVDAQRHEAHALRSSFSWRLTLPLRAVTGRARGLARRLRRLTPRELQERGKALAMRRKVAQSGLFDADWYRQQYPDIAASRADPLTHFMLTGWREGRQPSPKFDVNYYRYAHPDVAQIRVNPLAHYVIFGRAEGRSSRGLGEWARPSEGFGGPRDTLAYNPAQAPTPSGSIAVMVHAFYPDVFELILERLKLLPPGFALYVSTPDETKREAVLAAIKASKLDVEADVRVTQNRGRNFGPMLAEFSRELQRHDLMLHLHTKKSLHNASGEQSAWREDIYDALLGPGSTTGVLSLFSNRPETGLVYPATFKQMAYWANHWLQNAGNAPALFARLGVGDYLTSGYIDYPVGGMFWARIEAIRPLLQAGFTYDEFPPEAGQTDGTLAHAIERSFVYLARSRGFDFVESDATADLFRLGWSDKNLDRYEMNTPASLSQAIAAAKVVSFDLFDTIITRPSLSPDAVQAFVGEMLSSRVGHDDFATVRKAAELKARAAKDWAGDVGFDEIYACFPDHWDAAARDEARRLEGEIELRIVLPRPPIVEAVKQAQAAGKRVLVVSDTYFDEPVVRGLLAKVGLDVPELVLSNQAGARKDRGDLWKLLLERADVAPAEWLHVGDNEVSDMQRAGDLGLKIFHSMNPMTLLVQKWFLPAGDRLTHPWESALTLGPSAAALGADPFPAGGALGPCRIEDAHTLGYAVFGPVLAAFTFWLARQASARKIERVAFLAREGWALRPLYEAVRAVRPDLPASTYLYASRRAVLAARQAVTFDPEAVVTGPAFDGTLGDLVRARLGLEIEGAAAHQRLVLPQELDQGRRMVEGLQAEILAQAEPEAAAMRAYLTGQGTTEGEVAVVDVGYRGTIQKGLQQVLGRGLTGLYMACFPEAEEVEASGGAATGFFGDRVDPFGQHPLVRHAILVEAMLTAPEGQLQRFVLGDDGEAKPQLKPPNLTKDEAAMLAQMHAGAKQCLDDLLAWYGPEIIDADVDPVAAFEPVIALAEGRLRAPAEVLSALKVDDAFCGYDTHEVGASLAKAGA